MDEEAENPGDGGQVPTALPVVGVGVSARSIHSMEALFAGIGPSLDAAYVIAVRQQDGMNVQSVVEALQRQSPVPVTIGQDGEPIRPNHIYVGGPDDMITIRDGHLRVWPATEPVGHRATVDSLLVSVAEQAQDRAITVILGGLDIDGTAGVTATKKFGGLSIGEADVEDDTAQAAVGPLGVVDVRLPAEQIAVKIASYLGSLRSADDENAQGKVAEAIQASVSQITTIIRNVTGHDFHGYKRGTFLRRVHRRMQVLQLDGIDGYITRMRNDRQEVQDLFQDLLIGVTQFFRDPQEFEVLESQIPRLFEDKSRDDHFRVWVLGCATGEEAYSIAIMLREHMATLAEPPRVQIFATDLDARALGLARAGRYSLSIADQIRPDRLERWFVREGDTYCVSKELREMCVFSPHNVVKDAPFSRIDILSCRNLLIYLNADIQNRVISIFHFSLRPAGVLFLGSSENVSRHPKLFTPIDRRSRVFRRLETATRIVPDFPLTPHALVAGAPSVAPAAIAPLPRLSPTVNRQAEAVAERYAPAYVVVDTQFDVLHFSGRTGRFLEPVAGAATLNLINLVHRDLRIDLRSALHRALSENRRVEMQHLALQQQDWATAVNLIVEPVGTGDVTSLVVLFQDIGALPTGLAAGGRIGSDEHVQRMENELRLTRDRLQATIEELESTNEELKSSYEEYQSINEELQAAGEEMETSKEELQSVNEELHTLNNELGHRVAELGRSNSDLKNLLEATQIATVFLDNELRVRSFTPSATDIFHLLETDVGRPLGHVVARVTYPELQDDVRRVLKTLVPINRTVVDPLDQRHFAAKVLPYRSTDNYISGAVVTFTDLTAVHNAETALRESEQRLQALLSASSEIIFRMNADWSEMLDMWGGGFLGALRDGRRWMAEFIPSDDIPRVEAEFRAAAEDTRTFELEHRVLRGDGQIGWTMTRAVPIVTPDGKIIEWFGAAGDITARREAEDALRGSEQRLHSLVEGLPQLVWRAVEEGNWTWASRQWTDFTGQNEPESRGWGWLDALHPDDRQLARDAWGRAAQSGQFLAEYRIRQADGGSYRWFQTRALPVPDQDGTDLEWIGTSTDIDDLRSLQERQGVLVGELQHRTRNLLAVVRQVARKTLEASADLNDFQDRFRDRIEALARVQGLLSRLNEHDRVTFDELIETEFKALGVEVGDGHVVLDGPKEVRLRSSTVQTLAMALHELATNAVKYGALKFPDAQLTVRWQVDGGNNSSADRAPWLHIDWRETGVEIPPDGVEIRGTGQGRELIERALPYQLSARTTYRFEKDGVHCTISMPISATIAAGRSEDGVSGSEEPPYPRRRG
ncbi:CheR family methyltransferase [Rhizosaccharibacter radicis]|uniref:histidine kinase n=1 Tax=Rhizosaccharibacter radicis TaxID=2782605 RepID=A0ABT1VV53_9PROT|nr:PAS domain-containing protein [Acetobacteraceae bacterium KSS12]